MRMFVPVLIALFILIFPQSAIADESTNCVIEGQVINRTEDGSSVANVEITLISFLDGTQGETLTTSTNEEGEFQFSQLSADYQYVLLVDYMEIYYYYEVSFGDGEVLQSIEVPVFDTTTSDEAIMVRLAHVIIYVEEETFSVTEVFWLANDSDRTYVGEAEAGILAFTLPAGATDFEATGDSMSGYLSPAGDKIIYDAPFLPGERQLVYSYKLARPGSSDYIINLTIDYPTEEFHLLVEGNDVEVASAQLSTGEPVDTGTGQNFIHLAGGNFLRGAVIEVRLYNLATGNVVVTIILSVVAVAVIIGITVYLLKRKRSRSATSTTGHRDDTKAKSRRLRQELAQLNDDYEQGLISEEVFRQVHSEKSAQLRELGVQESADGTANE